MGIKFLKEVRKRGLQVAVAGIPKTIDNDIAVSEVYYKLLVFISISIFLQVKFLDPRLHIII